MIEREVECIINDEHYTIQYNVRPEDNLMNISSIWQGNEPINIDNCLEYFYNQCWGVVYEDWDNYLDSIGEDDERF